MNELSLSTIIDIILIIAAISLILRDLYTIYHHGKLIIKINKTKGLPIFWIVMLIIFFISFCSNINFYINYAQNSFINDILINICFIALLISNIITSLRGSEIRENGIYSAGYFYKWSKIESYNWILPDTIQFKVNTFFKIDRYFQLTIKEESKLIIEEVIQKNIIL